MIKTVKFKRKVLKRIKAKYEEDIKRLNSDSTWGETEYKERKRRQIISEKSLIIEAIDSYYEKLVEIDENK